MAAPGIVPGFYRHFKWRPGFPPGRFCYEVLGVSRDTEGNGDESERAVIYRPLYVPGDTVVPTNLFRRGVDNFLSVVEESGHNVRRFELITDPQEIEILRSIRDRMYPPV